MSDVCYPSRSARARFSSMYARAAPATATGDGDLLTRGRRSNRAWRMYMGLVYARFGRATAFDGTREPAVPSPNARGHRERTRKWAG